MTCREAFDKWAAGKAFDLPWMPADTELWDTWQAAWEAKTEADKQVVMFADTPTANSECPVTAADIYAAYPRKVGRAAAIKAIEKAIKAVGPKPNATTQWYGAEVLMQRVKAYAAAVAQWPAADKQFIPHPATWFNRGSYDDDPKEWLRGAAAQPSQFHNTHQ